jgi:hypothetical protein
VIRTLILAVRVICGDETPIRSGPGPKKNKKYLQVACTHLLTCFYLGDRDAARSCPGAAWPAQIAGALRGLIHAANLARGDGLDAVAGETTKTQQKISGRLRSEKNHPRPLRCPRLRIHREQAPHRRLHRDPRRPRRKPLGTPLHAAA